MNVPLPVNHLDQGRKTEERNRGNDSAITDSIIRRQENLKHFDCYSEHYILRVSVTSLKQGTSYLLRNLPGIPTSLHPHFSITNLVWQINIQEGIVYFG